ncbi:MAG TPA: M48 family metallopeptidase [Methanobacterium sp.]|nr:M48 family metallopeptidase [Methanobacterium sp.]
MTREANSQTYFIDTEISSKYMDDILEFIEKNYLKVRPDYFKDIKKTKNVGGNQLSFTTHDPKKGFNVEATIKAKNPVEITLISDNTTSNDFMESIKGDLYFLIHSFEDTVLNATLYFSWIEGEDIVPEEPPNAKKKSGNVLFGSSMLLLYVLFFAVNITLFLLLGLFFAIIAIIALQFLIVIFADKILAMRSNWTITPENPYLHILEYQLPVEEYMDFQKKFGKESILMIKNEIYKKSLAQKKEPTCELGDEVLKNYGFHCNPLSSVYKVVNVYDIVKKAADSFDLPTPKITISNTMIPNAAATGPSPNRGLVLITTGLLVHLNEEEALSVIGHEMGHLQGRDPIILFSLIMGEFLLRFTVLWPIVIINPLLYLIAVFIVIFFIAKFFETRADLLSAIKIGKPEILAESLRKIAFKKLQLERVSRSKIPGWLAFDPHPPIYFRIDRLERMETPVNVKNPLVQSAKDVINGFIASFR